MSSRSAIKTTPLASRWGSGSHTMWHWLQPSSHMCKRLLYVFNFLFCQRCLLQKHCRSTTKIPTSNFEKNSNEIILVYFCESNNLNNQIGLLFCNKYVIIIQHIFLYEWWFFFKISALYKSFTYLLTLYSQLRHVSTIGKKLVKQQYLLHVSIQYGELRRSSAH